MRLPSRSKVSHQPGSTCLWSPGGRLEHDEPIAERGQGDRAALELDLPDLGQLALGFDLVDDHAVVSRAGGGEPVPAAGEHDAVDPLLPGRGAIGLAQDPGAGGHLDRLGRLPVEPDSRRSAPNDDHDQHDHEHNDDLAARMGLAAGPAVRPDES